ncbi:DUF6456 domain-containing protein [Neorhizobium sp. NCHU2750]|uniref:DUF6456 domain-containing protein n=1 Tax=Neorhizobium sp. NCHU2750 TaxID=1825976 RepID=UPI000E739733|nr:hypothetical protein NCHU2750_07670 [Neorhizobium sp. NCHU2750]
MNDHSLPDRPSKPLLRLARTLLGKPGIRPEWLSDGRVRLGDVVVAEEVLRQALSLGLVREMAGLLSAAPEAKAFFKRAMLLEAGTAAGADLRPQATGEEREPADAYAGQHRDIVAATVELEGRRHKVSRNLDESPLSTLSRLKDKAGEPYFPPDALEAGERLLADFTRGQLQPRITASWEPRLSSRSKGEAGGMSEIAASAIEARRRFGRAMEAMGPELSGVAADICCFGKGLELVERERQWPVRSAKLMLRTALMALARHYAPPPARTRRDHHWGAEDFRPAVADYGRSAG